MSTQIYPSKSEEERLQTDPSQNIFIQPQVKIQQVAGKKKMRMIFVFLEEVNSFKHIATVLIFILSGNLNLGYSFGYMTVSFSSVFNSITLQGSVAEEQGLFSAVLPIGCIVGSLLSYWLIRNTSRNNALIIADLFGMSSILCIVPIREMILTFRFMFGVCNGISCIIMPIYIQELCPDRYQNQFSVVAGFQIGIGLLFSYLMGLGFLNSDIQSAWWQVMFAIPPLICLLRQIVVTIVYKIDSPLSLLKRNNNDCKILLEWIYQPSCVDQVYQKCQQRLIENEMNKSKFIDIFNKYNRNTLLIGIVLVNIYLYSKMFMYTWCGIFAVFSYSNQFFKIIVGDNQTLNTIFTLILGISQQLPVYISKWLYSKWGKRQLLLSGMTIIIVCQSFIIGLSYSDDLIATTINFIIICVFAFVYAATLSPICWGMTPEINDGDGTQFCILTCWGWQLFMLYIYPFMMIQMGIGGSFILFLVITVLSTIFFYSSVKETKGLTPFEIEQLYGKIQQI